MRRKPEDNSCDSCDIVEVTRHLSLMLSKGKGNRSQEEDDAAEVKELLLLQNQM